MVPPLPLYLKCVQNCQKQVFARARLWELLDLSSPLLGLGCFPLHLIPYSFRCLARCSSGPIFLPARLRHFQPGFAVVDLRPVKACILGPSAVPARPLGPADLLHGLEEVCPSLPLVSAKTESPPRAANRLSRGGSGISREWSQPELPPKAGSIPSQTAAGGSSFPSQLRTVMGIFPWSSTSAARTRGEIKGISTGATRAETGRRSPENAIFSRMFRKQKGT